MSSFKFRPSLESLDARLTPSVTVAQVGTELIITGDKEADVVRLRDNGQGQITGFATGVGFFVKNGVEKITVTTEGGDDYVEYALADYLHARQLQCRVLHWYFYDARSLQAELTLELSRAQNRWKDLLELSRIRLERLALPEQLFSLLRPLPGRLYSVASSPKAHPGEAHLLVGAVRWESHGKQRGGVASTYFADRRKVGDAVRVYVKPNRHFRLPEDGNRPIIMIGAGTADQQAQMDAARAVLEAPGHTVHTAFRIGDVEPALHAYQAEQGIDLLVMGAYGHSRLREFAFGGVSRHLLRHMTVPVLMSH